MKYKQMREECEEVGAVIHGEGGIDTCGFATGTRCSGYSCPSKLFWAEGHRQPGWHMNRALEKTGLEEGFKEEMA